MLEKFQMKYAKLIGCEGVQAIGSKIVLYKKSEKKPKIELPQGKNK